jgi:rSAM/selenodomain-associated transferase 2
MIEHPGNRISIVVPVLNESGILRNTLSQLRLSENEELIIVDGGSSDDTVSIARDFTDKVFTAKTGRASVMNFGASKAEGDILLFLHADCFLPGNGFTIIRNTLRDGSIAAGAFDLGIESSQFRYRIIECVANIRARLTCLMYGDQGMFLRKKVFDQIGGFADVPLMEDIEISKRLKKLGKIVLVKPPVKASPRRWLNEGLLYTTLRDWTIAFFYTFMKVSPEKLIKHYREVR